MSRERQEPIFKDFDVSVKHLSKVNKHYVPPKTRDEQERERLHGLAHGTLILEKQERGLKVASLAIKLARNLDDVDFMTHVLAPSIFNSSFYTFAEGADSQVQRRRLKLPYLAVTNPEYRQSSEDIRYEAAFLLGSAATATAEAAGDLQKQKINPNPFERSRKKAGRIAGGAALTLAAAGLGDPIIEVGGLTAADTQNLVRQRSLVVVDVARTSEEEYGVASSVAQLTDPYSPVSVYWHNNAPNGALFAFEEAQELVLAA